MKNLNIFAVIMTVALTVSMNAYSQTAGNSPDLNLDFEIVENGFPVNWNSETRGDYTNYKIALDSGTVKSGKYAVSIEFTGDYASHGAVTLTLPAGYSGKKITLSGYIKTENVTDGYAGLWMTIYGKSLFLAYDNNKITGTTGWKKYEITLDMYPEETGKILLGGTLSGEGKMWMDNLSVTVDGKDIRRLKPDSIIKSGTFPAKKDTEFDNGSHIVFPELDGQKIEDLELLGRIWGFLKYHHPAIAKGKYNWDYELFRFLPEYLESKDSSQRDKLITDWIKKLGKVPECKNCQPVSDSAFLKPDLSWIENGDMSRPLKDLLLNVYKNRNQGFQYYVRLKYKNGHPAFTNENPYDSMPYPDAGFRLLSLYRLWNMIQYFYPYKYLTDKDWNGVLKEYIPLIIGAKDELEYEQAVALIIGEVCDSHLGWSGSFDKIQNSRGFRWAPVRIRFIENKWVVTDDNTSKSVNDPDKKLTELRIGDIITRIDGKPVEEIVDSIKKYYPASNEAARMRDISNDLLRSDKSALHIEYISSGQMKETDLQLLGSENFAWNRTDTAKHYKFLTDDIGYVTLKNITREEIGEIKKSFGNTRGIVIDIRNYPPEFAFLLLSSYFVSDTTAIMKFTNGNVNCPGEFTFGYEERVAPSKETYRGKLVVLVNAETQSMAEYTTMAFRAGVNTTVIGSQTAGADGNASDIYLPGGLSTWISGRGVYYPDGRETQRIGIVPDIEVHPTVKGIREGRDEVLEKAIEVIERE